MDPAEYPTEYPRVISSPVHPAEYPAREACEWTRRVPHQSSPPVDPAEYPRVARQWIPPSIPLYLASIKPERLASICQWILPVSRQSSSPVWFCLMSRPGAQFALHFMLVLSCSECTLRLGKGDAFVLLWVANKQLRLTLCLIYFWKGLGFC